MPVILSPNPNDPRVIRTRQLIMDAFAELLHTMDFNTMTISDITRKATINRATFYAHFADKYALLEALLAAAFLEYFLKRIDAEARLTEETIQQLIFSLCDYHESSNSCVKKYDSVSLIIEENIKKRLEKFILQLITKVTDTTDEKTLETTATMLGWSIYGVTYRWNLEGRKEAPSALAQRIVPLIVNGVALLNASGTK
ncbi:TetR/AcrR family transcriptional regulator [Paenibacillus sp. 19GGS1-52]|uniref:TetR/AcrR family transcriptional regulator n=1 Tax=Paenibacillus sp. 19GGS1-52 TaxID=2758563 RepID=UPI001EFAF273|nr:TetR/AcrR family transcriptional regulator [Paenibacillus sp. 19GGS1-52]ULO09101.1 TetR/AcrR family transcriptional regulator [Paenibacillus sp. 19GGS1-52]